MKTYDVIILGGGPGGYVAAIKASQSGLKTALIEKEYVGGVCLNVGCIPTKTLLKNASVYQNIKDAKEFGIELNIKDVAINWPQMVARKDKVVNQLTGGIRGLLKANKVDLFEGFGEAIDKSTVKVNNETLKTKNIIIATGSSPLFPPIDGLKEAHESGFALSSKELLSIDKLPKSIVIVGGGVIGVEFATLFNTLGSNVTIVEKADDILLAVDKEVRQLMRKRLERDGVAIHTSSNVVRFNKASVRYEKDGKEETIAADVALVSIGRKANLGGFEALNVKTERGMVVTNEQLETNVPNVYAIGDVNGKYMLAHVASSEGLVAVDHILGKSAKIDYSKVPSGIYGTPEIASVGLTEDEAKEKGLKNLIISKFPLMANGKALAEGDNDGFIKIIADPTYGEVLGVHIISPHATDLISEAVAVMNLEGTIYDLANMIHPHPTMSEIMMEAAHVATGHPIHIPPKRK